MTQSMDVHKKHQKKAFIHKMLPLQSRLSASLAHIVLERPEQHAGSRLFKTLKCLTSKEQGIPTIK